jgi:hypothetical protein
MKRDFELLKEIMLQVEAADTFDTEIHVKAPAKSEDEIDYHIILLRDARYIEASEGNKSFGARPMRLTMQGHDFLSASKNDTIWNKTLKYSKEKGSAVTIAIFQALLIKGAEKMAGL